MPYYCNKPVWGDQKLGLVVKPKEWWRKLCFGKLPYFTYKHIRLDIKIKFLDGYEKSTWKYWKIWEFMPSRGKLKNKWNPSEKEENEVVIVDFQTTYVVSQEGDVEIRFCGLNNTDTGETLFSCKATSMDSFLIQIIVALIATIGAYLLGRFG